MVVVKSVKIDGENIHLFKSVIYIFESSAGFTLQFDMIVSELIVKKYKEFENLIVEIELEDGRVLNSIMHLKIFQGKLPLINLFCELDDIHEYENIKVVHEDDSWFPNIEEGITIEDIRKVEMPIEEVRLKLKLPIDQVEWLKDQKPKDLNGIFKEMIYELWKSQDIKR
ncbi:hypothetical protein [Pseudoneobacillus rhizosphaerae]|uniref:Uncharacterized protein n=1 Tax=Pseudoneobacillus rhizosphaerae TaxID=2880968 RepID=A0A9C7G8A0_9BACI|nr:hypothetical protein [Pseudoneobacillus rhizosphaerae]CAG9607586.1 hypothetical protein NEOCIP111885_01278 [Pseudoneobacillus rhizosphaerae]